jgi:recombination protein RecA
MDTGLMKKLEALVHRGALFAFGDGLASSSREQPSTQPRSTGVATIDEMLGGGLPRGRIVEIFGPPGIGKTSLALQLVAAAQNDGGTAAFFDADHGVSAEHFAASGVDPKRLVVGRLATGEQTLRAVHEVVSTAVDLVVVDSVASLVPEAELKDTGHDPVDDKTGIIANSHHAKMMSRALRRLTLSTASSGSTLVFINQTRHALVGSAMSLVTTGGAALPFHAALRLRLVPAVREGVEVHIDKARFSQVGHRCLWTLPPTHASSLT